MRNATEINPLSQEDPRLTPTTKGVYAMGDFTLNTALSALSLIFVSYFLTQVAGLRPALAGLVPLIGRVIDAFFDPIMGRISDHTRWRWGRRRPYLLIGALPFGLSFAMLWFEAPVESQAARFSYYAVIYCVHCLWMSVLTVPYLALQPEMAIGYDARTSLNVYRNAGSVMGMFAAIAIRPISQQMGTGGGAYALAGVVFGLLLALPWLAVHRVTYERPSFHRREVKASFMEGLREVARHRTFSQLTALYLSGRIAMDLLGALLILYFTYWLHRSEDFEIFMFVFLAGVVVSLPFWLRISLGREKATIFRIGAAWWLVSVLLLGFARPEWPPWVLLAVAPVAAIGYAVVEVMPWAMLGEVIDEDDLMTGERREGLYNGIFTFLRKLGGALAVFLALGILDWFGFEQGQAQSETTRRAIWLLTAAGPAVFIALGVWFARGYPLTRAAHAKILATLEARSTTQ